jgi:chromosome segregation ATPase
MQNRLKSSIIVLASILLSLNSIAQKEEEIIKALQTTPSFDALAIEHSYNNMPGDAYKMLIHGEERDVQKSLRDFVKTQCGVDLKRSKGVYMNEPAIAKTISTDSLSIIVDFDEVINGVEVIIMASRDGKLLNDSLNSAEMNELEILLERFSKSFYNEYYEDLIKDQDKELGRAQKDFEKLEGKVESTQKSIDKANDKLKDEQADIKGYEDDKKSAEAEIKKLEKEKENLQKEVTHIEENIERNKSELNQYQGEVDAFSASGDTEGRDYKKAMKALSKAQKEDMKLYSSLEKTHKSVNKVESNILKAQEDKNDAESDIRKSEQEIKELEDDIKSYERDLKNHTKEMKELKEIRDEHQVLLDKLKAAGALVPEL